jgi:hypothetical protein
MGTPLSGPFEGFEAPGYMSLVFEGLVNEFEVPDFEQLFGWKPTDEVRWCSSNGEAENWTTNEDRIIPVEVRESEAYRKFVRSSMRRAYTDTWEIERRQGKVPDNPGDIGWFKHKEGK